MIHQNSYLVRLNKDITQLVEGNCGRLQNGDPTWVAILFLDVLIY